MPQQNPNIMVAVEGPEIWVKINGKANFGSSVDLKKVVNELCDRGYERFIFDLSQCQMMDSTFLGVLAGIGLKLGPCSGRAGSHEVSVINCNQRMSELLENLGVSHLFKISHAQGPRDSHYTGLPEEGQASKIEVTRTCLEAHKTLMQLNPDNERKFKDVTRFMEEDLKNLEKRSAE